MADTRNSIHRTETEHVLGHENFMVYDVKIDRLFCQQNFKPVFLLSRILHISVIWNLV